MKSEKTTIRNVKRSDAPLLVNHRKLMFLEMNRLRGTPVNMAGLEKMCRQYEKFLRNHIGKDVIGVIIEHLGVPVSSGAASLMGEWPPSMTVLEGYSSGYIYGIYTDPSFRKQGLARTVMKAILKLLKAKGASVATLYASKAGVSLYESLGFMSKPSWMTLNL